MFVESDLTGASFRNANLDFTGAKGLATVNFAGANLLNAKGLVFDAFNHTLTPLAEPRGAEQKQLGLAKSLVKQGKASVWTCFASGDDDQQEGHEQDAEEDSDGDQEGIEQEQVVEEAQVNLFDSIRGPESAGWCSGFEEQTYSLLGDSELVSDCQTALGSMGDAWEKKFVTLSENHGEQKALNLAEQMELKLRSQLEAKLSSLDAASKASAAALLASCEVQLAKVKSKAKADANNKDATQNGFSEATRYSFTALMVTVNQVAAGKL